LPTEEDLRVQTDLRETRDLSVQPAPWGIKEFLEKEELDGFFPLPNLWAELQELKL
jgi:hypothetical protein